MFAQIGCRRWTGLFLGLALVAAEARGQSTDPAQVAQRIMASAGVHGGFVVHVGCGTGELTAALRRSDSFQVHGLDRDAAKVATARASLHRQGVYGDVAVEHWDGGALPYTDNLVNVLVLDSVEVPREEMMRVLAPMGVAVIRTADGLRKVVKPRPDGIDDWTHYLHDASGNAVAHDTEVGPPRHLQWVGSPRWSRHHDRMASMSALVSARGRLFYIMDEGSRVSIQLPPKWRLISRDAFNGTVLWKQPIERWQNHLWPLKSGPTQLARRLVATESEVYVTLGLEAPVTALDAATGEVLRTYDETSSTEELVYEGGTLYVLAFDGPHELADYVPELNVGDQRRVAQQFQWNQRPRRVMAVDAATGRVLWSKTSRVAPLSLAVGEGHVYFHDGLRLVAISRASGEVAWTSQRAGRRTAIPFNFGPKIVVYDDVVLFAGGDRQMQALDADTGKVLWTAPHAQSGYQSPEDLLVAGGLVWSAPTTRTADTGVYTGRDPLTGEVKNRFAPNVQTYWFHHRCYISKATDRFLLPSRTGVEFVDHAQQDWQINHWVRGGCLYGIMPCNGMVYAPPHDCACYPETKLFGLNALAPTSVTRKTPSAIAEGGRLQRGPAYNTPLNATPLAKDDWPTYRRDATRSGFTPQQLEPSLERTWSSSLGGELTAATVVGNHLYVAQVDQHTLHALDTTNGKPVWKYTTGGRIDSPPSYYMGRLLFGSADGWVYCLNAADGKLAWRFRAAPRDRRMMAFEQLESVWPVHGTVLVHEDHAYFVAGRSNFLDDGLRWFKLDARSGEKLAEVVVDRTDPETAEGIQARIQVLNMPVGLPDVLSTDGRYVYMRSQRFDFDGKRIGLGPHSGVPAEQGSTQSGDGMHLFSPTGFLDKSWFHRSYWVYGRSFAGGHAGYYQAGKYAPGARIMVFDDDSLYGYGRKPQYYKWTTILEHQLFSTSKLPTMAKPQSSSAATMVQFGKPANLNPAKKGVVVEAWANAERQAGVVAAHGGPQNGYALVFQRSRAKFVARVEGKLFSVTSKEQLLNRWVHLVGVLSPDKKLKLYVDGKLDATASVSGLIPSQPAQGFEVGADAGGAVGSYNSPLGFTGTVDELRVYHGAITDAEVAALARDRAAFPKAPIALHCSFDKGRADDNSDHRSHGKLIGAESVPGKFGRGVRFVGRAARGGGSFVKHHWNTDVPLFVRAMVLAGKSLVIAGPPDVTDEEETFQRLAARDTRVQQQLAEQAAALEGADGSLLRVVDAASGRQLSQLHMNELPEWDGMAVAGGKLFVVTTDGQVVCYANGR